MISKSMDLSQTGKQRKIISSIIICFFMVFLIMSGCSKSNNDGAKSGIPSNLSAINESLKNYEFTIEHFKDPKKVDSFLIKIVTLCCDGLYQEIASPITLKRMERTNSVKAWLYGRERRESVLRELCQEPKVLIEGQKWKIEFNVFRRNGSVEKWNVVGNNDAENEYNQINEVEIKILKSKGTFSWPMIG